MIFYGLIFHYNFLYRINHRDTCPQIINIYEISYLYGLIYLFLNELNTSKISFNFLDDYGQ
ncbi:hypothetical protein ATG71_4674 [Bacillus sp. es.034]|nr:hypothetical protein ATG71_4674 [Bacillus sp. es.034]